MIAGSFSLFAIAEPRVIVRDLVTMYRQNLWYLFSDGCFHSFLSDNDSIANYDDDEQSSNAKQQLHIFLLNWFD